MPRIRSRRPESTSGASLLHSASQMSLRTSRGVTYPKSDMRIGSARKLYSGQIGAAARAGHRIRLLADAEIRYGAWRIGRPLLECSRVSRKQVAMPAQLGRKAAERAQKLHVEPHARNVKIEEIALHQPNKIGRGKMLSLSGQIEQDETRGGAVRAHLRVVGEDDGRSCERCSRRGCAFHSVGVDPVIGGGEENEIAADKTEPRVARGVDTAIVAMAVEPQPRYPRGQRLQPRNTVVGRAVVDHDDFRRQPRLP